MAFNNQIVSEIKTVIKYVLVQFRDLNNNLIKSYKYLPGETFKILEYPTSHRDYGAYRISDFFISWVDQNNVKIGSELPIVNSTYKPSILEVKYPIEANVESTGVGIINQRMSNNFVITADKKLYIDNTYEGTYYIIATETHDSLLKSTTVDFKIDNYYHTPGVTKTLEPILTLFDDSRNRIGTIKVKIRIHASGQSTGD